MSADWKSSRADWSAEITRYTALLRECRAAGRPLLDLTVSNPTASGPWHHEETLRELLARAATAGYDPDPRGLLSAREALAATLSSAGDVVSPEDLILCASTSEAYSWLFKLCGDPGSTVLTPVPSYPLLDAICSLEGWAVRGVPMQRLRRGWRVEADDLDSAVDGSTRAIAVVHPNNPTGHALSSREADAIVEIGARRDLPVISDEVFLDYRLSERAVESSMAGRGEGLIFSLGGLSKALALPHWKLAWIRIGGSLDRRTEARDALEWIADTFLSVNTPVQVALPDLLGMRNLVQGRILDRLRVNLARAQEVFAGFPAVEADQPDGGWSLLLRVPAIEGDEALAIRLLLEEEIIVQPGYLYDVPWNSIVLSLLTPEADFMQGVERLASCLRRLTESGPGMSVDVTRSGEGESGRWS